jgi:hypothetical protein
MYGGLHRNLRLRSVIQAAVASRWRSRTRRSKKQSSIDVNTFVYVFSSSGWNMKWQEVRELFPNQFVLVSILEYHEEGNKKIVDEVAPIRSISDEDANKEFFKVEQGNIVYHTSNEECVIHIRRDPLMRVRRMK